LDITNRIDAVTKIGDDRISMGGIQPPPKSVKIELTARCNLRCKFCAVRTRQYQASDDMNLDFFKKITEDMRISGVEEIGLFYLGEPFMNIDLLESALKWCKEIGFPYVFITSNATIATPDKIERVMAAGLDSLKWSVNFATPEQFKEITTVDGSVMFKAFENIRQAYKIRHAGHFKTVLSASSILYEGEQQDRMNDILHTYIINHVDRHYWLPLYQMSMYRDRIKNELGFMPTAGNMGRIDERTMKPTRNPLPCWSAFTEGHVRVDGGLSACCFGADNRFDMGILDGTNFMKMWNSHKFQSLRIAQLKTIEQGQESLKGTPCEVCVGYS
jgi:pyruvate-formate lyase-activating enzyme